MQRLFVGQEMLDAWVLSEDGDVKGTTLTLATGQTFEIAPAIYFDALLDGDDEQKLLGKVKNVDDLPDLGVEHYADSAIVGETAYQVVEGFVGACTVAAQSQKNAELDAIAKAFKP